MQPATPPRNLTHLIGTALNLKLREALLSLPVGQSREFLIREDWLSRAYTDIKETATARRIGLRIDHFNGGFRITRKAELPKIDILALDRMEFGDVHTFQGCSLSQQDSIRNACSKRNAQGEKRYTCKSAPGGLMVTCLDPAADHPKAARPRWMYPEIDALQVGESHTFKVPREHHRRIRVSCSYRTRNDEGVFRCASVPDGLMVTRIDPSADMQSQAPEPQRPSKWGIERLETEAELRFENLDARDQQRLRLSASVKGKLMGWKVRVRINGTTATVTRVQAPAQ